MSEQLNVKVNSVEDLMVNREFLVPDPNGVQNPDGSVPLIKMTSPEVWHSGDSFYLSGKDERIFLQPVSNKGLHNYIVNVNGDPEIDAALIWSYTKGYWIICLVTNADTGINAPATVNISITPVEPDPLPPPGSN